MFEQDHSSTPDIYFFIIVVSLLDLGSHEMSTATIGGGSIGLEVGNSRHPKIDNPDSDRLKVTLDRTLKINNDVVWLDISVVDSTSLILIYLSFLLVLFLLVLLHKVFLEEVIIKMIYVGVQTEEPFE
jgi:hypothetical protein